MTNATRYPSLFLRLVSNTHEPENGQACWLWRGKGCGAGYGRLNLWVPGLRKHVTLQAHVALYVVVHSEAETADDLWLAYHELRCSGLEVDHLCWQTGCINPDHLEAVTRSENCRRQRRWSPLTA